MSFDGAAYQARFDELARGGMDVHGEAAFVRTFAPRAVLDAGCGTGRVAIELARHGIETVGVDVSPSMIAEARRQAPALEWIEADLAGLRLGRVFDVVVLAGNVPLFCPAARRAELVASCALHVAPGRCLVAGFQLDRDYTLRKYDSSCTGAGLALESRWATWSGEPFSDGGGYAVSVHRRPA
ncbi:MAG: class I SAM-dependent methyltransferase [Acidimicrobiales bacterium]|nr:class I SAM-dependent methyltransferase [Acidimicrobiales bacterium]